MGRMTPKKAAPLIAIALTMTGLLTGVMSWFNRPDGTAFLPAWTNAWVFALLVMLPAGVALFTLVNRTLSTLAPDLGPTSRNVVTGVFMALVMESIMATSVTWRHQGFGDDFGATWLANVAVSLPVAMVMSGVMSALVKPRLDRYLAS